MAAFFADKEGGTIAVLKLVKLLYLADRESLRRYGEPITYDSPVSMPKGPVLSRSLDLINGFERGAPAAQWDEWMKDRAGHDVQLKRHFERDDLDELSDADVEVLEAVWDAFGHMDKWTLSDWTHDNCAEWNNPHGSSAPIDEAHRLIAVGKSHEEAAAFAREIQAERALDKLLACA